ncbi:hypothetical protein ACIPLC_30525 [Kitasatospora sp. NPDC086801]|uniref:hypothetical protein n=1 Tax=Kitasatospora sp. NPDC086801 TaxID=3364066 RepID=UPI003817BE59
MPINLPNRFTCLTRTAVFDEPETIDFREMAQPGVPGELLDQLRVRRFLVSLSRVSSEVSERHSIEFTEVLVKIPVRWRDRAFLFPVAGYVDHEHSLIRGYLLGFRKFFTPRSPDAEPFTLSRPDRGLDVDLRDTGEGRPQEEPLPGEQELELLLWRDYDVGPTARSHGLGTLTVEDYVRGGVRELTAARGSQTVAGREVPVRRLFELRDGFVVTGTVPLADPDDAAEAGRTVRTGD